MSFGKMFNFFWLMVRPDTPETDMARLGYELKFQVIDDDEQVISDEFQGVTIQLPAGKYLDVRLALQPNQVDVPVPFPPNCTSVDFIYVKADASNEVVIKFGGPTLQAFTLRPGGSSLLDVKNISNILVTNANAGESKVRILVAVRQ